ncbi:cell surface A33 antigen-like [Salminus brasiliensis]|uniref:cell surface A33 antigen-like n=1 Tax=Salminus brasiliensis TaxID=930266 RepID=UPI003B839389
MFTWKKLNTIRNTWKEISSESDQYRDRVQLVNDHSPANLSLLISHLTEEDEGEYRCDAKRSGYIKIRLIVKEVPPKTTQSTAVVNRQTSQSTLTTASFQRSNVEHHIQSPTEGCTLNNRGATLSITALIGKSVLLSCYCTNLLITPETFIWRKLKRNRKTWQVISSESDQYRDRVQMVNDYSPANLSLLISHLTKEDGGLYRCSNLEGSKYTGIRLTIKGCTLDNKGATLSISAHIGESVLLPCYCTDLLATPETFTWRKIKRNRKTWEEISSESDQYRDRVQMVNDLSPANLSLLISHLTKEDGGDYVCDVQRSGHINITLTVKGSPQSLPFVPFALVTVIFLHIIVAVVYHCKRNKAQSDPARVLYSPADGDGVICLE